MNKFFYHGFEFYPETIIKSLKKMINILDEGLVTRNTIRNLSDNKYNHVCLYRKNDEYDYEQKDALLKSARGGWIDNSFVIIINPSINAKKIDEDTNLIDEWRSNGNISSKDIVGIALPYNTLNDYLNSNINENKEEINQFLKLLHEKATKMNLMIENSDKKNFTDLLDSTLEQIENKVK